MGLHFPSRDQLITQALVDDSSMRLQASRGTNLHKHLDCVLFGGSLNSYYVLRRFGMFKLARIHGWERLYLFTFRVSLGIGCYKCPVD